MGRPSQARIDALVARIAKQAGVSPAMIRGASRRPTVTRARWRCWRELHDVDGFGFAPIALAWGCCHTSLLYAQRHGWGDQARAAGGE